MTLPAGDVFVSPGALDERRDTVTIVDVREPRAYEEMGHVPGAVNIPFERLRDPGSLSDGMLPDPAEFAEILGEAGIAPDDDIVAYDGDRGVYAARFLLTAAVCGHAGTLQVLDGDYRVWQQSRETTTEDSDPTTVDYAVADPGETPVVDRETVEAAVETETVLVDTRTPAEYDSAHIPGAVQLSWEALVDEETRQLRPRADIEALLADRGITADASIILYCNTARRLSHTYAVLQHLGYEDVSFYEGSLTDWIRASSSDWSPQQLYERVREVAPQGFDALPEELGDDIFSRLHLIGLYTQKQDGYFMLRTKVPGGRLTSEQAAALGEIADEFAQAPEEYGGETQNPVFGDGYLDVTTRQGIQMHWIRLEDMPEIWDRYAEVGLTTIQASGNTLRNVVTCPAADTDGSETVQPLVEDVVDTFEGSEKLANLPRKLKVSITDCHENCGRAEIQDLGFLPAEKDGRDGFQVKVGGGLSDGPRAATDLGIFVEPEQVAPLSRACADLFVDHGSYLDTAVNRLKFLVEEWGVEQFRDTLQRYAPFEFESAGTAHTTGYRGDHVGVHEQPNGTYAVGLNVPTGRMNGTEFAHLAELSRTIGDGEVRVTPNQNVLLPNVTPDDLDDLRDDTLLEQYSPDPGPFSRGIVTCTGSEFCSYGIIETKTRGIRLARELDAWLDEELDGDGPEVVRMHMSGCSASCAQPQIADIGFRGETYRDEVEGTAEAVDIGLGGNLAADAFTDWITTEFPAAEIPELVERLVTAYEREHSEETFGEWLDETPTGRLHGLATPQEVH